MAIKSYFFNAVETDGSFDRVYDAEDVTSYLDKLVGNGVFPNPADCLQVFASSGMNVVVRGGQAWINGHKLINTAAMVLPVDASDVVLGRIDRVVAYVDHTERACGIEIKKGTLAADPVAPEVVRTDDRYELSLATIAVPKQATTIRTLDITDTRMDSAVCGYVQGLIQQISTDTMWAQQQSAFDAWFQSVQDQFEEGKSFKKKDITWETRSANENTFAIPPIWNYRDQYDVLEVYINGIHLKSGDFSVQNGAVVLTTPISLTGQMVTIVLYQFVE